MKKAGIITFHRAKNYGAVLQAYALQHTVESLGAECEIIDYRCASIEKGYKPFQFKKKDPVRSVLKSVLLFRKRSLRIKRFSGFYENRLRLSKKHYTAETIGECRDDYDVFITGSDQVWGQGTRDVSPDSVYFLKFAEPSKRFSYAASIGSDKVSPEKREVMTKLLSDFQNYSVREKSAAVIIDELLGKKAEVNLDPTLLVKPDDWAKIAAKPLDTPYILVFNVKPVKSLLDFAQKLSEQKNLPVVFITDLPHKSRPNFTYVAAPAVEDFLGYFKNAEYVVTNSFHGTAFSLIFKRNLFVEFATANGRNTRSENLLNTMGISREIVDGNAEETAIDWNKTEEIIEAERQRSLELLRQIIR